MFCGFVFDAFEDDTCFAHRSADKTFLSGERGSRAFANNPVVFAAMRFAPGKVVVVVNFFLNFRAEDFCDTLAYPVTAGVRIFASKVHADNVLLAKVGRCADDAGFDVHTILRAAFFKEPGGKLVAEAARAKMNPNPNAVLFVSEKVDVMISRTDGTQLLVSHFLQWRSGLGSPSIAFE